MGDGIPDNFDVGNRMSDLFGWLGLYKNFSETLKPKFDSVMNHLRELGVTKIGAIGFCIGTHEIKFSYLCFHSFIHSLIDSLSFNLCVWYPGGWVSSHVVSTYTDFNFTVMVIPHPSIHAHEALTGQPNATCVAEV